MDSQPRSGWTNSSDIDLNLFSGISMHGIIILLGSPNDPDGRLSSIAQERCEQVILEYAKHPDYRILPTGGFGPHFNTSDKPHGYHTTQYLISRGIPKEAILPCVESTSTITDARLSRATVEAIVVRSLLVVTSDFHVPRATFLFEREFPSYELKFSGSPTLVTKEEMAALQAHEIRAIAKLKGEMAN